MDRPSGKPLAEMTANELVSKIEDLEVYREAAEEACKVVDQDGGPKCLMAEMPMLVWAIRRDRDSWAKKVEELTREVGQLGDELKQARDEIARRGKQIRRLEKKEAAGYTGAHREGMEDAAKWVAQIPGGGSYFAGAIRRKADAG